MTKILIVEDEPAIAQALEDDLTLEGYRVEVIRDGGAAVAKAREEAFDAILLDIMLPGMDGFEVCELLGGVGPLHAHGATQESDKVLGLETGGSLSPAVRRTSCGRGSRRSSAAARPLALPAVRIGSRVDSPGGSNGKSHAADAHQFRLLQAVRARGAILTASS
jgi:hypothetical protein